MSEIIGEGDEACLIAGGSLATKRKCNRHSDCDKAKEKAVAEGRNPFNICCHSEDCEDCFGQ